MILTIKNSRYGLIVTLIICVSFLAETVCAQQAAPLIRRPSNITVRKVDENETRDKPGSTDGSKDITIPKPVATPNPEKLIVAIVNQHSITRAQLDRRVQARTRLNPQQAREQNKSTQLVLDNFGDDIDLNPVDEYQANQIEAAIREEESTIIQEWQEQMLLADEARRHGFLVTNQELQAKLVLLESEFSIGDKRVDNLLNAMGMTRAELESFVYDALLIEKLLERFIDLNYTDADLFNQYEQNAMAYRTPPRKKIAHFTEALLGNERKTAIRRIKDNMESIRDRLRDGDNPQEIIEETNQIEFGLFGSVLDWSTESNVQNRSRRNHNLPDPVVEELFSLEVGKTSKVIADQYIDSDGTQYILSFHVIKVLDYLPAQGETFEEALPLVRNDFLVTSRDTVLRMIRDAKTHKRVTRLSGIPADKLPTEEELRGFRMPISLKIGS